jgi:hypothetical protein
MSYPAQAIQLKMSRISTFVVCFGTLQAEGRREPASLAENLKNPKYLNEAL